MLRIIAALLLFPGLALADTVGPEARMTWDYVDPMPSFVDGFRLYCNDEVVYEGDSKLINIPITKGGDYQCYVVAYNTAGESEASNALGFTFVTTVPPAPTVLRFAN